MLQVIQHFIPALLAGFVVNLEIAVAAVLVALAVGVPLSLLRRRLAVVGGLIRTCIALMQALPTYVTMFFMLMLLSKAMSDAREGSAAIVAVVLAQSIYLTAYVAEEAYEAMGHLSRNDRERALLFLPNLMRGFIVVVMSSGFGAAVGVSEAVSVTMRQAERLPAPGDRILLFVVAIAFFATVVASLNVAVGRLIRVFSPARRVTV
jgi:hypothetical protein